jgi:hypothetical protein
MNVCARDLYPIVQDLTDAEYGCCSSEMIFGSFSLQELVVPSTTPRSLPSPDRTQLQHDRKSSTQSMQRDNSLLENESADSGGLCGGPSRFEDNFVLTRQVSSWLPVFSVFFFSAILPTLDAIYILDFPLQNFNRLGMCS